MKISAQMLVKNEEKFIWFSVLSVIDYVDEFLIWDDGSTDKTLQIIKFLAKNNPKIKFKEIDKNLNRTYSEIRQAMLDATKAEWVLIIDGDEIWWEESIAKLVDEIKSNNNLEAIVTRYINCVGDIFHYLPDTNGKYEIDDQKGFLTIRAMSKKIPGLHYEKPHGQIGIFDKDGILIQERDSRKRLHIDGMGYMHMTHLRRSSGDNEEKVIKRLQKFKYELGIAYDKDYFYPESFFYPKPYFIESPWSTRSFKYELLSILQLPLKKIKRLLPSKSGY